VVHKQRDPTYEEAAFVIKTGDRLIKALSGEPIDAEPAAEPVPPAPTAGLPGQGEHAVDSVPDLASGSP
jgi:hypothetical protein